MDELDETQIAALEAALRRRKAELEALLRGSAEGARPVDLDEPIGRLSRVDALQRQQLARAQRQRDEQTLRLVGAALSRIRQGSYGACARCEEPIGYARLQVRPEATLCLGCQAGSE